MHARVGLEWALTMLGGGGNPAAWWDVGGVRSAHDTSGAAEWISTIAQGNDYIGVSVTTTAAEADAWWAPIETVSNSENGFERMYQGSALLLSWPLRLAPRRPLDADRDERRRHDARPGIRGHLTDGRERSPRIRQPAACAPRADVGGGVESLSERRWTV